MLLSVTDYQVFCTVFCSMQITGRILGNMEGGRKGSGDVSASCVHILPAAVTGSSAVTARSKINWVTLRPGIQEVQPQHQRYKIPTRCSDSAMGNGRRSGR